MSYLSPATEKLLTFALLPTIDARLLKVIAKLDDFEAAPLNIMQQRVSVLENLSHNDWQTAKSLAQRQIEYAQKYQARIISILDKDYPRLLANTANAPCLLYVRGRLPKHTKTVAIVGTRQPSSHGKLITERITEFFTQHHWSIVSGLARGCDTYSHQRCLDKQGHTIAVLAHGLHKIAPYQNKHLGETILANGGALVSQFPFGQEETKQSFALRDFVQAGLAQGVVMIQSSLIGGSLHAARASLKNNRWLAVPHPTQQDIVHNHSIIVANQLITTGTKTEQLELLKCQPQQLHNIISLFSKDDYAQLLNWQDLNHISTPTELIQETLF